MADDSRDGYSIGTYVRHCQEGLVASRACAKSPLDPFPLILSLSKDALCNRRMVRQAHHERMRKDFAQALGRFTRAFPKSRMAALNHEPSFPRKRESSRWLGSECSGFRLSPE